jgi:hypothetical protein
MDPRVIQKCKQFIQDREIQRREIAIQLKIAMATGNRFMEIGERLGEMKPFIDYFYGDMIRKFGNRPSEFYRHCNISAQVYSNMQRDNYDPSIQTIYKIILGLKFPILEATILMENAGYTFTFKTVQQLVVLFCIINGIYDPYDVDELLIACGSECLFV